METWKVTDSQVPYGKMSPKAVERMMTTGLSDEDTFEDDAGPVEEVDPRDEVEAVADSDSESGSESEADDQKQVRKNSN